ncbi:phosphoadenosine phosphosulfate reductase [Geomicrobium halophilum]|uniref:Adenosine 5'-phosphosulfate reductase n=1 Tax=Geomicrobium halophilum TaxID=549000 RepID=A0A841PX49_9BACL|nr:phosphoadenylyl-sulfate reductase [Geomicrobium halophilum]MBB6448515.1 phosphoadenosine phosphosulfate reductase [Geomicrobium halophilum]
MLTISTLTDQDIQHLNDQVLMDKSAKDVLTWSYETFGDELVYSCSLGAEGMVLLDLIEQVHPGANVIFLDTGLHFKETYALLNDVRERFSTLNIKALLPENTVEEQKEKYGDRLWARNPDQCCAMRKFEPLQKELSKYTAWISGLRRAQSPTRAHTPFIGKDHRFSLLKICPLIHWTQDEVWDYIYKNNLPYNPLHEENYPSIGCAPCTAKVLDGGDERAGRWSGMEKTECGLHWPAESEREDEV